MIRYKRLLVQKVLLWSHRNEDNLNGYKGTKNYGKKV